MPDPRGGKRGTCPPEVTASHTLPPEKNLKNVKRHAKNWYKCESNTCAFTECKNGRTLVKYGNLRSLIRDQTTPHCDARNSKCQIEREVRKGILPPTLLSWHCDWCFLSANNFQCHQTKTNTFVYTLRMFHKIYFVWHWLCHAASGSVSRENKP